MAQRAVRKTPFENQAALVSINQETRARCSELVAINFATIIRDSINGFLGLNHGSAILFNLQLDLISAMGHAVGTVIAEANFTDLNSELK